MLPDKIWALDLVEWEKFLPLPLKSSEVLSQVNLGRFVPSECSLFHVSSPPAFIRMWEPEAEGVWSGGMQGVWEGLWRETGWVRWGWAFPASTCYLHQKPQDFSTKRKMCWKMSLIEGSCSPFCFCLFSQLFLPPFRLAVGTIWSLLKCN